MKKTAAFMIVVLSLCAAGICSAQGVKLDPSAPSWPKWRGPNGNGIVAETSWNPKAVETKKPIWTVSVGKGYSSVCVIGKYLFTVGMKTYNVETVSCLDGTNGKTMWSFAYPSKPIDYPGSRTMPVFDNGRLYVLSLTGQAYCLDAATGAKVWDADIAGKTGAESPDWGFASSALIEGDMIFFNVGKSGTALNKKDGSIAWKSGTAAAGYATPVGFDYKGKRYLAIFGSTALSVVESSTGKLFASTPWNTGYDVNAGDPVVTGDTIFIATNYGVGGAMFRLGDGSLTQAWKQEDATCHFSSGVYIDGYIYCSGASVGGSSRNFYCLNAKDGSEAWAQDLGVASLIAVGSRLLITTEAGDLIIAEASPKAFTQVARAKGVIPRLCWTAPVFAAGKIYLRSDKGDLLCMDASK